MREEQIRPAQLFDELLRLAALDAEELFPEDDRIATPCAACGSSGVEWFVKNTFVHRRCDTCLSVFVSPRPREDQVRNFYRSSRSADYWTSVFYPLTAESRRHHLWPSKAQLIHEVTLCHGSPESVVIDIGGGFGVFADVAKEMFGWDVVVIEPGHGLAEHLRSRSIPVVEKFMQDVCRSELPLGPRVFVSFELLEHLQDPVDFLRSVWSVMDQEDLLIMTSLSSTGIDVLSLGERSKVFSAPFHLNFFNPISAPMLLLKAGLECIEVLTPGRLDVSIMENSVNQLDSLFLRTLLQTSSQSTKDQLQQFVSNIGFSSHIMFVARKIDDSR